MSGFGLTADRCKYISTCQESLEGSKCTISTINDSARDRSFAARFKCESYMNFERDLKEVSDECKRN